MRESQYQSKLIKKLKKLFPGCIVLKNDAGYLQGVPDLILLYEAFWAGLEVKLAEDSDVQPNQQYYVEKMGAMSYAAFIHPGNEAEVLNELQFTFGLGR